MFCDSVSPFVADAVRELLLLSPEHLLRDERLFLVVESLSQNIFFYLQVVIRDEFAGGVDTHHILDEAFVEEWGSCFKSPGQTGLIGSQEVVFVQILHFTHSLLVEFFGIRGLVEVKIPSEKLISALSSQAVFNTHGFNLSREKIHRSGGSDGGVVIGLGVANNLRNCVDSLFYGIGKGVMLGSQIFCHNLGCCQIGRPL